MNGWKGGGREASGEEERREAEAAAEAAVLGEAAVYGAADWAAVQEALRRMMPEENGMVFRPAEPPEWRDAAKGRPVFLWQAAAGKVAEPVSDGGGERAVLFSGRRGGRNRIGPGPGGGWVRRPDSR